MKASSLRDQSKDELRQMCEESTKVLFDMKAKKGLGEPAEHPLKVRLLRRDLARIKTVLREQELKKNG